MAADDTTTAEQNELRQLRARVRELEASQRQLEIYAEDLRRTFGELRRQLGYMNELHRISTAIGAGISSAARNRPSLEPKW